MQKILEETAGIGDNADVKEMADRYVRILDEQDTLKEDAKELLAEAKGKGIDTKAFKDAVRLGRKEQNEEHKVTVNMYLKRMGHSEYFA